MKECIADTSGHHPQKRPDTSTCRGFFGAGIVFPSVSVALNKLQFDFFGEDFGIAEGDLAIQGIDVKSKEIRIGFQNDALLFLDLSSTFRRSVADSHAFEKSNLLPDLRKAIGHTGHLSI